MVLLKKILVYSKIHQSTILPKNDNYTINYKKQQKITKNYWLFILLWYDISVKWWDYNILALDKNLIKKVIDNY
jgi:hypothetical protein